MGKRNYTHVQAMRPEIKTMLAEGKIRQEVAEHYSFQDKQVVKKLLERERARQRKLEAGIIPRPKSRPRKPAIPGDVVLTQAYEIQRLQMVKQLLRVFCNSQEGSEAEDKIPHHISSQRRVHRPCQGRGICMPTPWRKIFSPSSKPSAFTTINRLPFMKPMR